VVTRQPTINISKQSIIVQKFSTKKPRTNLSTQTAIVVAR